MNSEHKNHVRRAARAIANIVRAAKVLSDAEKAIDRTADSCHLCGRPKPKSHVRAAYWVDKDRIICIACAEAMLYGSRRRSSSLIARCEDFDFIEFLHLYCCRHRDPEWRFEAAYNRSAQLANIRTRAWRRSSLGQQVAELENTTRKGKP